MKKRLHPMMIVTSIAGTLKSYIILILYLFVFKGGDPALWVRSLQAVAIVIFLLQVVYLLLEWLKTTYEILESGIAVEEGVFKKKQLYIAFDRVQNVQQNKPFYLNMFDLVAVKLETGAEGADLTFPALKEREAERIEAALDAAKLSEAAEVAESSEPAMAEEEKEVHFAATKKDILKASFLSFSYFAIVPVVIALFSNAGKFINVEKYEEGFIDLFLSSWQVMTAIIIGALILMILAGIATTFIRYGNSVISSDVNRIYLKSGMLNVRHFSVRKDHVQAVRIDQSLFKRLLGLASVELVTAGGLDEEMKGSNTLYPFLPAGRAAQIVSELLPAFEVKQETQLQRLPVKAFGARLIRFPWLFAIALAAGIIFWREYWYASFLLLLFTIISRYLDYKYSGFLIENEFIQLQTGGWQTSIAIMSRSRIIELNVKQSVLKARFGLAALQTKSRGKPVNVQELADMPAEWTEAAYHWYAERRPVMESRRT